MARSAGAGCSGRGVKLKFTPLGYAARYGHEKLAAFLVERGASPQLPDDEAWGPQSPGPRSRDTGRSPSSFGVGWRSAQVTEMDEGPAASTGDCARHHRGKLTSARNGQKGPLRGYILSAKSDRAPGVLAREFTHGT